MIDRAIAQTIIGSLSSGTVPVKYVDYFNVGRSEQEQTVLNEIENKLSKLRFVNGDYGSGKTQFLSSIRHWALENGYIPTHVILSPRGTPLHNLTAVYSRIMKNLVIDDQEMESPIEAVLEFVFQNFMDWVKNYSRELISRCPKTFIQPLYCEHCNKSGLIEPLYIKDFNTIDIRLQLAIIIYRSAKWGFNPDFKTADIVIRWIEGEPIYRKDLNYYGLWDQVVEEDILKGLKEVGKLVSLIGKKGIIIMLDEAEGIESLTPFQKPIAYKNLEFLLNGAKNTEGIYFLYATTPSFYNDVELYSTELADTINKTACTELLPLSLTEKKILADKISNIFLDHIDKSFDENFLEHAKNIQISYCERSLIVDTPSVRDFITGFIKDLESLLPKRNESLKMAQLTHVIP